MRYFVTGTGTDVGKTFVTASLARRARELGKSVFAFKPIETGCAGLGTDQEILAISAGDWQRGELRSLYRFPLPAAPLAAAEAEGQSIDIDRILAVIALGAQDRDVVLVEGVGGWRVPLTLNIDVAGWAHRLGWPVLIVGAAGLGTINHSLLTIESVVRAGCSVAGLVLSVRPFDDPSVARANARQISRIASCNVALSSEKLDDFVRGAT